METDIMNIYEAKYMDETKEKPGSAKKKLGKDKFKNRERKLKKVLKALRKQLKLLKKAVKTFAVSETQKVEDVKKDEQVEHDKNVEKVDAKEKSFWRRLGDAVIKAVPSVLIQFVGKVCASIFKNGFFKPRWAVG